MSISRDTETVGTAFVTTGAASAISHPGSASARAACVLIDQNGTATDEVSGVTYGGVAMSRVRSESEATEAGRTYIYWLDNIPTGTQNVVVTTTAGTNKQAVVATMLVASGKMVAVAGSATGTSASVANPSWTISGLTSSSVLMAYEVIHSGLQTMTTTPASGWTLVSSTDLGSQGRGFARQAVASSGTTLTCGWTAATADDFVADSVAFIETDPPNVTHDVNGSSSNSSSRTLSFAVTLASTAKKLYVAVICGVSNDTGQTAAVNYHSVPMSDCGAGAKHSNNGTAGFVQVFELTNPDTGSSYNVDITVSGGNVPGTLIGIAESYSPASGLALQTGTPVTAVSSGSSPITVNVTSTTSGNMVYGAMSDGSPGITALLTSRALVTVDSNSAAGNGAVEDTTTAGGTVAVGFTVPSDWGALIAFEIQAVASADTGTGSVRMKKPGLSGVATAPLQGTGSIRIKKPGLSGSGQEKLTGTGSVRMKKPSATGLAAIKIFATGSVRIKKPALTGAGQEKLTGTGSVRMKKMGVSGVATAPLLGSGSVRMHKPSLAITGTVPIHGTGSVSMHKMSLSATGKEIDAGSGSASMHKMGILASGSVGVTDIGSGSIAMHKMSLSATGKEIDAGTGSVRMHKMGLAATGHAPLLGSGSVSMHKPSLSATGKEVDAGTGSARMKKMSLSGTGHAPLLGSGSASMHKMGILAAGVVGTFILGTGSVHMKKMGISGSGQEVLHGSGSVSMHKPSISGLGAIIVRGSGSVRAHKMSLSGSGKEILLGSGSVHMHKMVVFGTTADLGSGSVGMHKMGIHGIAVGIPRASNLFIFTAV